jgi:hypothetical protein
MSSSASYDLLYPSGKQISGIAPVSLKKAIEANKIPIGSKIRKGNGPWVDVATLKSAVVKQPVSAAASTTPPAPEPPKTRMMYPLPAGSPSGVHVLQVPGGRFAIEKDGSEVCTVADWESALRMVEHLHPKVEIVAQPVYKQEKKIYESQPAPQQSHVTTHVVVHNHGPQGNKLAGILIEIFLVPLTGWCLGGLGPLIAGKGNGSLFMGIGLWIISFFFGIITGGLALIILFPIILIKWFIDIIRCVL